MISRHIYSGGTWVDVERPTENEIHHVAQEFSISERLETELGSPTPIPLVANDVGATLLVLHFPTPGTIDDGIHDQEVDFVVGNNFIITVRYEVIAPLHRLKKLLETQQLISPDDTIATDVLLETLFAHLYTSVRDHTSLAADRLAHIERDMFSGHERTTVRAISDASREFLHIEASLANQEEPLSRFLKALSSQGYFGKSFTERADRILSEHAQVARLARTYRAVATELRETNASLLEARQNEVMKTLTVITVLLLPLQLITFIFGMHAHGTPLEQDPNAFWIILTIMLIVSALTAAFFIKRRWL